MPVRCLTILNLLIDHLRKRNKYEPAETYHATLNSLKKYFNGKDIMIDRISSDTVEAYEVFLQNRGLTPNTTSFYMRIFRAVYNRAISESKIERRNHSNMFIRELRKP